MGDVLSLTDPDNNATSWTYDGLGRETGQSETVALSYASMEFYGGRYPTNVSRSTTTATSSYQYDLAGNLTQATDADGRVTTYAYNAMNEETGETWYGDAADAAADTNSTGTVSYSYDVEGRMLSAANEAVPVGSVGLDPVASYGYQYDCVGNLTGENVQINGTQNVVLSSTYDSNRDRTSLAANIGGTLAANGTVSGGAADFIDSFGYDGLDRLTDITQGQQDSTGANQVAFKWAQFSYDADSRLTGINRYVNADALDWNVATTFTNGLVAYSSYTYDHDSRLTDLSYFTGHGTAPIPVAYHWTYDADGEVTDAYSQADTAAVPNPNAEYPFADWGHTHYIYDADGKLTATTYANFAHAPASNTSLTYDSNGNRTNAPSPPNTIGGSNTGVGNRLLFDGTYYYSYDADGNCVTRTAVSGGAITAYTWNNANQLTSVSQYAGTDAYNAKDATSTVDYFYDAFGRMVRRVAGETTENYVYDGENLALEMGSGGLEREFYVPGTTLVLATEGAMLWTGTQPYSAVTWLLTDNQGSVRDEAVYVYNETTGLGTVAVGAHEVYDAFGQITWQGPQLPGSRNQAGFGYDAMLQDSASGLDYDNARWYNAVDAVFASTDPIGFGGGQTNLSAFVGNSPTNWIDPSGMAPIISMQPTGTLETIFGPRGAAADLYNSGSAALYNSGVAELCPGVTGVTHVPSPASIGTGLLRTNMVDGTIASGLIDRSMPLSPYDAYVAQATMVREQEALAAQQQAGAGAVGFISNESGSDEGTPVRNEKGAANPTPPPIPPAGDVAPGPGWRWVGPDKPGGPNGAWVGPEGDSLHPDLSHGPPKGGTLGLG